MPFKTPERVEYVLNKQDQEFHKRSNDIIGNLKVLIEQERRKERAHRVLNPKDRKR